MSANGHLYYPGLLSPHPSLATRNKIIWLVYSLKGLNKGKVMTRSTAQYYSGERGCYYILQKQ